jgi:hypothetical protein
LVGGKSNVRQCDRRLLAAGARRHAHAHTHAHAHQHTCTHTHKTNTYPRSTRTSTHSRICTHTHTRARTHAHAPEAHAHTISRAPWSAGECPFGVRACRSGCSASSAGRRVKARTAAVERLFVGADLLLPAGYIRARVYMWPLAIFSRALYLSAGYIFQRAMLSRWLYLAVGYIWPLAIFSRGLYLSVGYIFQRAIFSRWLYLAVKRLCLAAVHSRLPRRFPRCTAARSPKHSPQRPTAGGPVPRCLALRSRPRPSRRRGAGSGRGPILSGRRAPGRGAGIACGPSGSLTCVGVRCCSFVCFQFQAEPAVLMVYLWDPVRAPT